MSKQPSHYPYGKTNSLKNFMYLVNKDQIQLPLELQGTVKLHGTNAGVYIRDGKVRAQSRKRLLSSCYDNSGFYAFTQDNKDYFISLLKYIRYILEISNTHTIVLYGEWCGDNIQKGVALNKLPKMFVIFSIEIRDDENNTISAYNSKKSLNSLIPITKDTIYHIHQFPSYTFTLENHVGIKSKLEALTDAVDKECPVAKQLGVKGFGEGIVWSVPDSTLRFKVKGDSHVKITPKARKNIVVDWEAEALINEFIVSVALTQSRLEQGLQEVFGSAEPDIKQLGDVIKWIVQDVFEEEEPTIQADGLSITRIKSKLPRAIATWFKKNYV
jgi:hypothetical protein